MSKKSFSDIEQAIKNAAEAYEPAFDEQAWKKMEALLDKEKDRKRPFIFWLWWLIPILLGAGVIGYFTMKESKNETVPAYQKNALPVYNKTNNIPEVNGNNTSISTLSDVTQNTGDEVKPVAGSESAGAVKTGTDKKPDKKNNSKAYKTHSPVDESKQDPREVVVAAAKPAGKIKGKTKVNITPANPESDPENAVQATDMPVSSNTGKSKIPEKPIVTEDTATQLGETVVIKIEAAKQDDKEIEKIVDSVISKKIADKKTRKTISKIYVIVAAGAEASGVKLFSADKVTPRYGAALGFQINKKISVQGGFFVSNKKYIAGKDDYKTKPGSYWAIVDLKSIDGNCRVYEIPVQVRYDFTSGKKLNFFATAGLSSYLMKKENYTMHYLRYGNYHKAEVKYTGNNSFFSVLRFSAGAEKKISDRFAVFASPGIAVPLAGVGEGEVKLYSTDIILGLKFTPAAKNKK